MCKKIKTSRLEIKPYKDSDRPELRELLTNHQIRETFMMPDFKSEEELDGMVKKIQEVSYLDDRFERGIYLNDHLIGWVNDVEIEGDQIELGYVIHPDFQNMGYAKEMLNAVIYELLQKGFTKILTAAFEENVASICVMKKCGMIKIDKEDDIIYNGKKHHCIYYSADMDVTALRTRLL